MLTFDLLIPWLSLAVVLIPLLWVQRWIHRHLFGMGFLLSREKQAATFLYYLFLLPGVFLHEFSQYMMAGVFGIRSKKFTFFPEAQEDGSLDMGFVELEKITNPVYAALIGIAPLITGMLVVVYISNNMLDLPGFFSLIRRATDVTTLGTAINYLVTRADFPLWTYILFAVANAMMPGAEDRRGWWIIGAAVGVIILFLTIIGLQASAVTLLQGPIASALAALSAVFGIVLAVDVVVAIFMWIVETILERATGHRVEYRPALAAGAATALAAGTARLKSVYDLKLPIPPAPGKVLAKPAPARLPAGDRPAIPAGQSAARPGIPASAGQQRPAQPAGSAPRPAGATGSAFGSAPARPAAQAAGTTGNQPAKPAGPISGPPALARPGATPPAAPKPGLPATTGGQQRPGQPTNAPRPAGSSPFGAAQRPGGAQPPRFGSSSTDDDYIDADVIEDDDVEYVDDDEAEATSPFGRKPTPPAGSSKPRSPFAQARDAKDDDEDDGELKYFDDDEA